MKLIYLDENASATPSVAASERAAQWLMGPPSNASSVHFQGRRARGAIEQSRRLLAQSLGVNSRHLTFTSGATEALNAVITGVLSSGDHVLVSAVEHPAVWGALEQTGAFVEVIPVDRRGYIDPEEFTQRRKENTRLAIMMAAQNEIGTIYPIKEIADRLTGIPLLVDAVQAYGKVPLNLEDIGATYAVVSGHKIGAPQGVGAIWCRNGEPFRPLLRGGAQERGRRAGTENIAAIVGLGVAAAETPTRINKMRAVWDLRERIRQRLCGIGLEHVEIIGHFGSDTRERDLSPTWREHGQLANTINLITPQIEGDLLLQQLDLAGFCLSSGSACSSGALEPSPVLLALGYSESEASRGLRISLGVQSSQSEVDSLLSHLQSLLLS